MLTNEQLREWCRCDFCAGTGWQQAHTMPCPSCATSGISPQKRERLEALLRESSSPKLFARDEWNEDLGTVLWWCFPIKEPPYATSPLDDDFPEWVTHFTLIQEPKEPTS